MSAWDGRERRLVYTADHDLLTRIDANLTNFMSKYEAHVADDVRGFGDIDTRLKTLERGYWIAVGVIVIVEVLIKLIN